MNNLDKLLNELKDYENDDLDEFDNITINADSATEQYLSSIKKYPKLSAEEEYKLFTLYQKNKEKVIRDKILLANQRLVIKIAKNYLYRDFSFLDLIHEGNIGLIKAIEKFDITLGYKFSTYASIWINQSLMRGIDAKANSLRLPYKKTIDLRKYRKEVYNLQQKYLKNITYSEIEQQSNFNLQEIYEYELLSQKKIELNTPVLDQETEFIDLIADETAQNPSLFVEEKIKNEEIIKVINKLNPVERAIITYRFGLNNQKAITLKETAEIIYKLGLSDHVYKIETIRLKEEKILKKLRNDNDLQQLL